MSDKLVKSNNRLLSSRDYQNRRDLELD